MINKLTIEYYTPDLLPPYAYNVTMSISNVENGIIVDFKQQYFGREEFTKEELEEEGFTDQDNFSWKGELNNQWKEALWSKVGKAKLTQEEENHNIHITITDEQEKSGYLEDENLEYLIQEIQQAIFEAAGKELPFTIHFKEILKGVETFKLTIIASFLTRQVALIKKTPAGEKNEKYAWGKLKELMNNVFSVDYNEEAGLEEEELKEGYYIEPGDEFWYPLPGGIEYPDRNFKKAEVIINKLKNL